MKCLFFIKKSSKTKIYFYIASLIFIKKNVIGKSLVSLLNINYILNYP